MTLFSSLSRPQSYFCEGLREVEEDCCDFVSVKTIGSEWTTDLVPFCTNLSFAFFITLKGSCSREDAVVSLCFHKTKWCNRPLFPAAWKDVAAEPHHCERILFCNLIRTLNCFQFEDFWSCLHLLFVWIKNTKNNNLFSFTEKAFTKRRKEGSVCSVLTQGQQHCKTKLSFSLDHLLKQTLFYLAVGL